MVPIVRKYECFNDEQQRQYERLNDKMRAYVDGLGRGLNKSQSIREAGYKAERVAEVARGIEKRYPFVKELAKTILDWNAERDALAKAEDMEQDIIVHLLNKSGDDAMKALENNDAEMAKRITFYNKIIDGRIKTTKVIQEVDPRTGAVLKRRVEEVDDVATRIKAREKLDEILGVRTLNSLGKFKVKDITINIVDAGKKDELEDKRNMVDLDVNQVEVVEGEAEPINEEVVNEGN